MHEKISWEAVLGAISYAARAHQGQVRKDGQTPYAAHPMRVAMVLAGVFGVQDRELLMTAMLHDTIEDTTSDFDDLAERFGERVAHNVALLTKDMRLPEEERERVYLETLARAPAEVQLCKLADAYDNLTDSATLSVARRERTIRKSSQWVELFRDNLASLWPHALEAVSQRVEAVRASLEP